MDLEQMQKTWLQMSKELDQQKNLTNELIMKMAQRDYNSKINKLIRTETIGAVICLSTIVYVLYNFSKFQSWQSQLCAIILIITLLTMSVGSFFLLKKFKEIDLQRDSLKITVEKYTRYKRINLQFQKASIMVGFIMLFVSTAVFSVLFSGKDLFIDKSWQEFIFPMTLGLLLFGVIAYIGSRYYAKALKGAQNIINSVDA
ncbi:hypothetical protein [Dokdonia sp. Hel_I_53]|uniref:hypothetical protein n=1 Tax=Dokdonia sp. Hel_I_53 TaxID=1566287 RepID=UPI00119ACED1|nr:hypothetical protein [Dokdonia sp. Hel_I_53]TVZ53078.1 hypothetical protein OD90_2270 [Dokdonia sp. Hel_I_53]